ncbi:MAG: HU family DNA-binding protein [Alloprevotella sp.]|nr:HU family DNA-binding protein [Alloprevotella sp.]
MSRRILFPELAALLAERSGVSKQRAEAFMQAFFDTIETGLAEDKLVKVKGFGTFKVVSVSARESVDVNTGERITLEGRNKITFTPDNVLKEIANKPFAQFQTITLPEEISEDDLAKVEQSVEEELATLPVTKPEATETAPEATEPKPEILDIKPEVIEAKPEAEETKEEAVASTPPATPLMASAGTQSAAATETEDVSTETEDVPTRTEDVPARTEEETEETFTEEEAGGKKRRGIWKYLALLLWTCAMFLAGYLCGNRNLLGCQAQEEPAQPAVVAADSAKQDSAQADTTGVAEDSLTVTPQPGAQEAAQSAPQPTAPALPLHPKGNIDITGQMGTHTLTRGESIEMVAKKHYGSKDYAYYIIKYNELKNPDIVHVGTQLKLPELRVRQ